MLFDLGCLLYLLYLSIFLIYNLSIFLIYNYFYFLYRSMEAKTFADAVPARSKPLVKWWKLTSYGRGKKRRAPCCVKKRRAPCCVKKSVMSKRVALDHYSPRPQKHTVTLVNSGKTTQSQVSNFETDDNLVLNAHRIASVYREMSVCKSCLSGELELYDITLGLKVLCFLPYTHMSTL